MRLNGYLGGVIVLKLIVMIYKRSAVGIMVGKGKNNPPPNTVNYLFKQLY
jgi:hypothetical protein